MTTDLAPQLQSLNAARSAMIALAFAEPPNNAAIDAKAEQVKVAELALAAARAEAFAKLQASEARLAPNQARMLNVGVPRLASANPGTIPNIREAQVAALTDLTTSVMPLTRTLTIARNAMTAAALAPPRDDAAIRSKADAIKTAELAVAAARA